MSVVLKTGDHGVTSLFNGKRIPKYDPIINAIGSVQHLGYLIGQFLSIYDKIQNIGYDYQNEIQTIYHWLFDLGAFLAKAQSIKTKKEFEYKVSVIDERIKWIENRLPKQTCFLLPIGGSKEASKLFIISSMVRKAERDICFALKNNLTELNTVIPFINRLSDYFYVLARYFNKINNNNVKEIPYIKNKKMKL